MQNLVSLFLSKLSLTFHRESEREREREDGGEGGGEDTGVAGEGIPAAFSMDFNIIDEQKVLLYSPHSFSHFHFLLHSLSLSLSHSNSEEGERLRRLRVDAGRWKEGGAL